MTCKKEIDTITGRPVYIYVDQWPVYKSGKNSVLEFFMNNYIYPKQDRFEASFELEFIIDEMGKVVSPRIKEKKPDELSEAEKEAIRVLGEMPRWEPGKCNGRIVPVKTFLSLKF